jgi:choline dehydrogenase
MNGVLDRHNVTASAAQPDCEYIVVGSGAGGGTVAARLAEAGHTVILLEAGGDPRKLSGGDSVNPTVDRLPFDYDVPCFHPFASENEAIKWDFFVRHYGDDQMQRRDPNYREEWNGQRVDGVLYPRAGTLGGCTAHNAMIMVYPHDADWDSIAALTGDSSWNSGHMRSYFQRLERCRHRGIYRWLAKLGINPTRHGFSGWLQTEKGIPMVSVGNRDLLRTIFDCAVAAIEDIGHVVERARWLVESELDPNDWRTVQENSFGIRYTPLTTRNHARTGSRERVLEVARRHPDRLRIELNALVTRVLLDETQRAIGVEYMRGERLYRAHARPSDSAPEIRRLFASQEVILSGGAFNSPQLLMLSGIGPAVELQRLGIEVRVDLAGVGKNLQDRYEVGVVNKMDFDRWHIFEGAKFDSSDPQFHEWKQRRQGPYITNAGVLSMFKRSAPERPLPDLFCVAFLGRFEGYFPNYSRLFVEELNYLTWAVLKAHTNNRAGEVTLRSRDPRDMPQVNFRYFQEGTNDRDQDLDSVVDGIRFVRRVAAHLREQGLIAEETLPGTTMQSDEELRDFVRTHAWGHHASCSCAIGPREANGVLDSAFRVHGTHGLRVVDASVFPRIPGFFIASAVYMIGEKAADVILQDAKPSCSAR